VRFRTKAAAGIALLLAAIGVIVFMATAPGTTNRPLATEAGPAAQTVTRLVSGPTDLKELLALDPAKLADLDIARVNLLCAEGLPGSEKLDVPRCTAVLDRWADRVRFETDRHLYQFRSDPAQYEGSEGYFRMLVLISVLQQEFGVHYNPARIRDVDFTHSADLFIHGMIPTPGQTAQQTNGGTCVSMPVLYTAVARRLGYPIKLVGAKAHLFCRWDALDHAIPTWRGRFNVEATNRGMNSFKDAYYKTGLYQASEAEIKAGNYLQSLTPTEELAEFLATRGHCLVETGRTREAVEAYTLAVKICPSIELLAAFRSDAVRRLNSRSAPADVDSVVSSHGLSFPAPYPLAGMEPIETVIRANPGWTMAVPAAGDPSAFPSVPTSGGPQPFQPPVSGRPPRPPMPLQIDPRTYQRSIPGQPPGP